MGLFNKSAEKAEISSEFLPYKQRKDINIRQEEVSIIRAKHPDKVPIIVERHGKESNLPHLSRSKFLAPQSLTVAQLLTIIRGRMHLSSTQTIFLFINNRTLCSMSQKLGAVYSTYKDEDGFVYFTYASQEAFG